MYSLQNQRDNTMQCNGEICDAKVVILNEVNEM